MSLLQDVRYALRQLRRSPGFAVTVVLTLALGIGATTAIYSLVDGVLLKPLPLPHPEQLVAIRTVERKPGVEPMDVTSYPDFLDWRARNKSFSGLAAVSNDSRLASRPDGSEGSLVRLKHISPGYFGVLGVQPMLGRDFAEDEDQAGNRSVILSFVYWQSAFASDPKVVGEKLLISSRPYTVIGVMPKGLVEPQLESSDMWTTFALYKEGAAAPAKDRGEGIADIIGRLNPGVNVDQAGADLDAIQSSLSQSYQEARYRNAISVEPKLASMTRDARPAVLMLLGAVGGLLLIVCTNIAGLMLTRGMRRRGEIALRTAMGASRQRIWRQLLAESLILGLAAGLCGVGLAYGILHVALPFAPDDIPRIGEVGISLRVLGFTLFLTILCAVLSTLFPAWNLAHRQPLEALREHGQNATSGKRVLSLQSTLVVTQTAIGVALLIASVLLIRGFVNVTHVDKGFKADHLYAFMVPLTIVRYPDEKKVLFFNELLPKLEALPGVHSASGAYPTPLSGAYREAPVVIDGRVNAVDHPLITRVGVAEPGFFETIGVPLLQGRGFTMADNNPTAPMVAIVNEAFVKRYFPRVNPIGRHIRPDLSKLRNQSDNQYLAANVDREIVGVVRDYLQDTLTDPPQPMAIFPYAQASAMMRPTMVLRVSGEPMEYENQVRAVLRSLDPFLFPNNTRAVEEDVGSRSGGQRFEALLVSSFAAMAVFLSGLSLYATLSAMVTARGREIALRMAVGADREDVARLVLWRALRLVAYGLALGSLIALAMTRVLQSADWAHALLFGVSWFDPRSYLTILAVLGVVSIAACLVPTLRAMCTEPMRVLREE